VGSDRLVSPATLLSTVRVVGGPALAGRTGTIPPEPSSLARLQGERRRLRGIPLVSLSGNSSSRIVPAALGESLKTQCQFGLTLRKRPLPEWAETRVGGARSRGPSWSRFDVRCRAPRDRARSVPAGHRAAQRLIELSRHLSSSLSDTECCTTETIQRDWQ
jgi:hypothetical protein